MAVPRITKEDLRQRLEGDEAARPVLADVRRKYAWDHSTLKLPAAIRLDPKAPDVSALPRGRDLVVYCSDPNEVTSVDVAVALMKQGISASVLKGGLPEWVGANLPSETKDAVRAAGPAPAPAAKPAPPGAEKAATAAPAGPPGRASGTGSPPERPAV